MGMKQQNLAFIDLETTGLDLEHHEIIEIGCVLTQQIERKNKGPELEIREEFDIKISPGHIETADPKSLKINGYSKKEWGNAISIKEAVKIVSEKTKGAIMVGHNVSFDWAFLERAFLQNNIPNQMHYHKLDTVVIAFAKLYDTPKMDQFSLKNLCDYFNIENKKAHTALSDAKATYELYRQLLVDDVSSSF